MARIIVIDDNAGIRTVLRQILEAAGHEVFAAANGAEGLEMHRAKESDIVITDILMPEKEGLETIRELLDVYPGLRIIAMSGGGKSVGIGSYLTTAREMGAEILLKPFEADVLISTVERILSKGSD